MNFSDGAELWLVAWRLCNSLIEKCEHVTNHVKGGTNQELTPTLQQLLLLFVVWRGDAIGFNFNKGTEMWLVA